MPPINIKAQLVNIYPELKRFNPFKHINIDLLPYLNPRTRRLLRWSLPVFVLLIIFGIGLPIGAFIVGLINQRVVTPPPVTVVTPSPAPTYQSPFLPIKQSIEDFNPSLPDPVPPVIDEKISLEQTNP